MTTTPTPVSKRSGAGIVAIVACALACSLPVLGGLLAGSFLDRVLDGPWLVIGIVTTAVVAAGVMFRRRRAGC
jgi:hypothetical protein